MPGDDEDREPGGCLMAFYTRTIVRSCRDEMLARDYDDDRDKGP